MKPPIDRIDGPREDGQRDFRRGGRVGLALIIAAKVVALVASIAFPLIIEAYMRAENFVYQDLQFVKSVRWVLAFVGTIVTWIALALLAKVPKVATVALAAVVAGMLGWALPFSQMLFKQLGLTRGGLTSPFALVDLASVVVGTAYTVLVVLVARRAAEGLSGKASLLLEKTLYALYAVALFANLASVVVLDHFSGGTVHSLFDQYDFVFTALTWLGRGTRLLVIILFLQVFITTKRERATEPA